MSKVRVALVMLVLFAVALGAIALLAAVHAAPLWFTILPIAILAGGAVVARSTGLLNKK
ncbi:hypothetical protein ACTI_52000 [Actinoplanes sp. OR16]|uniref:hypothetical protein n=1 Tax=Actinoplanes sp. OR16 TaxID=946334 RepID=UPI000F6DC127|nr:hypothetical protein [Actinoplanes sp. OR16]BBH68515.1 hypothetical protein ACTI_52000 [Actinoplanes sp. OR16]